jgi:hypothetical protein
MLHWGEHRYVMGVKGAGRAPRSAPAGAHRDGPRAGCCFPRGADSCNGFVTASAPRCSTLNSPGGDLPQRAVLALAAKAVRMRRRRTQRGFPCAALTMNPPAVSRCTTVAPIRSPRCLHPAERRSDFLKHYSESEQAQRHLIPHTGLPLIARDVTGE